MNKTWIKIKQIKIIRRNLRKIKINKTRYNKIPLIYLLLKQNSHKKWIKFKYMIIKCEIKEQMAYFNI